MKLQQHFVKSLLLSLLFSVTAATYADTENTLLPPEPGKWQKFKNFAKPKLELARDVYEGIEYIVSDFCQCGLKAFDDAVLRLFNGKFSARNFVINNRVRMMFALSLILKLAAVYRANSRIKNNIKRCTAPGFPAGAEELADIVKWSKKGRVSSSLKAFICDAAGNVALAAAIFMWIKEAKPTEATPVESEDVATPAVALAVTDGAAEQESSDEVVPVAANPGDDDSCPQECSVEDEGNSDGVENQETSEQPVVEDSTTAVAPVTENSDDVNPEEENSADVENDFDETKPIDEIESSEDLENQSTAEVFVVTEPVETDTEPQVEADVTEEKTVEE